MSTVAAGRAAGLGQRTLAWSIDVLLLSPLIAWFAWPPLATAFDATLGWLAGVQLWVLERVLASTTFPDPAALAQALLADPVQGAAARAQVALLSTALLRASAVFAAVTALYFVAFEASPWQATPGKRWLGLRVETRDGARPGFARVLVRHVAGLASWLTLNLGHAMAGLRDDKRALHDLIAGTRVSARGALSTPGRVALGVLLGLAVLAPAWLVMQVLARLAGA